MKRVRQALSLLAIPFLVAQASLEASILHLSEGCLQLLRTAGFEIGYRTGDGVVHHMPTGWQGCYEGTTGLSCAEREINGRQAWLLLHPWKIHKEARIFLGYEVQLPEARKLELRFSVMMDPVSLRIQENGKTAGDGVNFSVEVNDECLFEYFGNDGAPRDFSVDLSRFSGQLVRLRLLADRGPNGDSEHDLAYYVEPVILADGAVVGRESRESPVFPGYRFPFPADLRAVRNSAGNGILPSNSCNFSNGTALLDGAARLSYHGEDGEITYVYRPETGTLDDLQCLFPDGRLLFPAVGGGIFFAGSAVPEKTRLLDFRQDGQEIVSR